MLKLIRKIFARKLTKEEELAQYHNQLAAITLLRIALKGK